MLGFPGSSNSKESACNVGDLGLIFGSGSSPGEGHGIPLHYSCLENSMDRGACWAKSMGSQRVGHYWVINTHTHTHTHTHLCVDYKSHKCWSGSVCVCVSICAIKVACSYLLNRGVRHIVEWNKASSQWNLHCQEGQIKKPVYINNMLDGSE